MFIHRYKQLEIVVCFVNISIENGERIQTLVGQIAE